MRRHFFLPLSFRTGTRDFIRYANEYVLFIDE